MISSAAQVNLGDAEGSSSRLERILQVGEIISATATTAKTFAAKFFPGNSDPIDLDQTASMLTRATEEHDNVLLSATRGGVKVALAMLWAWYPDINMHMDMEYMLVEDENGNAINPKEFMASVSGYATRLANLVNIGVFYKAHPDPTRSKARHLRPPMLKAMKTWRPSPALGRRNRLPKMSALATKTWTFPLTRQLLLEHVFLSSCNIRRKNRCVKL